jgi:succinate dehydrogenase hydrophobic anchor subunit
MDQSTGRNIQGGTPGFWLWLCQRLSGVLLILLVLMHGWFTHFDPVADVESGIQEEAVVFDVVKGRLAKAGFVILDFALLAAVLYHGLNGVRNILLEWKPAARRERPVTLSLWVLGLVTFAFGARALAVFIF